MDPRPKYDCILGKFFNYYGFWKPRTRRTAQVREEISKSILASVFAYMVINQSPACFRIHKWDEWSQSNLKSLPIPTNNMTQMHTIRAMSGRLNCVGWVNLSTVASEHYKSLSWLLCSSSLMDQRMKTATLYYGLQGNSMSIRDRLYFVHRCKWSITFGCSAEWKGFPANARASEGLTCSR